MPKTLIPKFENPLFLADFLKACLDDQKNKLDLQIYALKGLFLLLQNHGLDYPKYYEKLYALLLPQKVAIESSNTFEIVSVFSSVDHETKNRFLRVLDLSLRSSILPSKLIAAFIKRLGRVLVSHGSMLSVNETMFAIAQIANLIKRHPRCLRLV